ncbi:MAG: Alanine racemase [Candidatus Nomurabacteria bacterium GW2011_GWB1_37_5]|uniref:Alanine racemase n=1 Tax=Candidatus Nomurabacteria bacterium GW2011_GWB1_37_5 TaxID=1618742 RepID=A0A0G0JBH7_9BACT|nr:MAG: Alanine racemase [Candidatus Nomurabacteria bacterium GW2011_GWB1_37_5]
MAVVKSNAYGHGLVSLSKIMQKLGADYFGVDDIDEALVLRKNGIKKSILVFGYIPEGRINDAITHNISITVSNFETFNKLKKLKNKIKIHLKVDTGLGRQGFLIDQVHRVIKFIKQNKNIKFEGLYTHFAGIESKKFIQHTKKQITEFNIYRNILKSEGFDPIIHVSPSAGLLLYPEYNFDMVRAGISIYGLWPSKEIEKSALTKRIKLRPVLSWKSVVCEIKKLPKGNSIGYDRTEILKKNSKVAVIPIGYWHGYRRNLSSFNEVVISGKKAKVLGRVSMDMMVVDITSISKAKVGDEVILIGKSGKQEIKVDDLAKLSGTINYEFVTQINPNITRIYK